jgi:hypothetical protein
MLAMDLDIGQGTMPVRVAVEGQRRDPVQGTLQEALRVVPEASVRFLTSHSVVPHTQRQMDLTVAVRRLGPSPDPATVQLDVPEGWTVDPRRMTLEEVGSGEEARAVFRVIPPDGEQTAEIRAAATLGDRRYSEGFRTVGSVDIGTYELYQPAVHRAVIADLVWPTDLRLAYIMGSGDLLPDVLAQMGTPATMLTADDLQHADLSIFDVILVGVRAYAVRDDLRQYNARLLQFVRGGGTLIVQYQTPEFDQNFGPYPYRMGSNPEEVSEEDSALEILVPDHPWLQRPNRIGPQDFQGWVEQRGSKFWKSWDDRYLPLLELHDHDQPGQRGAMLVAPYGEGLYVYSALAWYRQLPEGVPGAYRLFANLLTLGQTRPAAR